MYEEIINFQDSSETPEKNHPHGPPLRVFDLGPLSSRLPDKRENYNCVLAKRSSCKDFNYQIGDYNGSFLINRIPYNEFQEYVDLIASEMRSLPEFTKTSDFKKAMFMIFTIIFALIL